MRRTLHYVASGVGNRKNYEKVTPTDNHFSGKLSKKASAMIAEMELVRLAGNVYASKTNAFELASPKEFWRVDNKNGGLVRLTSGEVDNDEHLDPAPKEAGEDYLRDIMSSLEL